MTIVIIGAGVAGLSIGLRLVEEGADVTILDRGQAGHGATWASAGMIAPGAEFNDKNDAEAELGKHSASLWPDFARELEEKSGMTIGYRPCGAYLLTRKPEEESIFRTRKGEFLNAQDARKREPLISLQTVAASYVASDALVDNRALGAALLNAFLKAGGKLSANEAVLRIESEGGRAVAVRTPFHRYEADAFLLCAGAWSGRIEGLPAETLPPVIPVKGQMIALAPPANAHAPSAILWGPGVYMVPRGHLLLVGATVEETGFDTSLTTKAREWLLREAKANAPDLAAWTLVDHWAGLRPGSPDGLPILGRSGLGDLYVATGQFRNGILFAPAIAEFLSGLILGRTSDLAAFDPRRFGGVV